MSEEITISYSEKQSKEEKTVAYCPKCGKEVLWGETIVLGYQQGESGWNTIMQFKCGKCNHIQNLCWHGIVERENK